MSYSPCPDRRGHTSGLECTVGKGWKGGVNVVDLVAMDTTVSYRSVLAGQPLSLSLPFAVIARHSISYCVARNTQSPLEIR